MPSSYENHKNRRLANRRIATEFLDKVKERTTCEHCGAQPVEWHNPDHVNSPNARIGCLRTQGASIARIQKELDACTALCRTCHMKEDGRMEALRASGPYKKGETYVAPKPCKECGRDFKPLRRGWCYSCYMRNTGCRKGSK